MRLARLGALPLGGLEAFGAMLAVGLVLFNTLGRLGGAANGACVVLTLAAGLAGFTHGYRRARRS